MGFNYDQLNQGGMLDKVLSTLPYPMNKDTLITTAQRMGANPQIINVMKEKLPNKEFKSAEDIKSVIRTQQPQ